MTEKACNCKEPKSLGELNDMMREELRYNKIKKPSLRVLWLFLRYQWQMTWSAALSYAMTGEFIPNVSNKLMKKIEKEFLDGEEFKN